MIKSIRFTNECGNTISIRVAEKEISSVEGILIEMAGPTSDTELHITKLEAKILYEELGTLLKEME